MKKFLLSTLTVLALAGLAPQTQAAMLQFDLDNSASNGSGPFGNIQLTDVSGGVNVHVTLAPSTYFAVTGAGYSVTFNLNQAPSGAFTNITSGFGQVSGTIHAGPGNELWGYAVQCLTTIASGNACNNGGSTANSPGPLDFKVSGVTTGNFTANSLGYFSVDIYQPGANGGQGATFVVWANDPGVTINSVPEPMSMSLMGLGLVGLGLLKRHRSRK